MHRSALSGAMERLNFSQEYAIGDDKLMSKVLQLTTSYTVSEVTHVLIIYSGA